MKIAKKKIYNIIGIIVMVLALVYIIKTFLSFDVDWRDLLSLRYIFYIMISVAIMIMVVIVNSYCWHSILSSFNGKKVDFKATLNVYSNSNLGKYLPGNVGHYAGRQLFGASVGLKQSQLILASIMEIIYNTVAAFLLSVLFAWGKVLELIKEIFPQLNIILIIIVGICAGVALILLLYFIFRKKSFFIEFIALIKTIRFWVLFLKGILFSVINLLMIGIMLTLLISVNASLDYNSFITVVTASVTSWFIGFIAPGVPGGIGVRESVLILMLASVCPSEVALVAGLFQRISFIIGDVLVCLISRALLFSEKYKTAPREL